MVLDRILRVGFAVWSVLLLAALRKLAPRFRKDSPIGFTLLAGLGLGGVGVPAGFFLVFRGPTPLRAVAGALTLYSMASCAALTLRYLRAEDAAIAAAEADPAAVRKLNRSVLLLLSASLFLALALVWPALAPAFGVYPDGR